MGWHKIAGETSEGAPLVSGDEPIEILARTLSHLVLLWRYHWQRNPTRAELETAWKSILDLEFSYLPEGSSVKTNRCCIGHHLYGPCIRSSHDGDEHIFVSENGGLNVCFPKSDGSGNWEAHDIAEILRQKAILKVEPRGEGNRETAVENQTDDGGN